jgi:hypothetical protein
MLQKVDVGEVWAVFLFGYGGFCSSALANVKACQPGRCIPLDHRRVRDHSVASSEERILRSVAWVR